MIILHKIYGFILRKIFNMQRLKYLAQPIGFDFWREYIKNDTNQFIEYIFPIIKTAIAYNKFFSKIISTIEESESVEIEDKTNNNRTNQYVYIASCSMGLRLEIRFELVDLGPETSSYHNGYVKVQFKILNKNDGFHLGTFYVLYFSEETFRCGIDSRYPSFQSSTISNEENIMGYIMKKVYDLIITHHLKTTNNMIYVKNNNLSEVEKVQCVSICTDHIENINIFKIRKK